MINTTKSFLHFLKKSIITRNQSFLTGTSSQYIEDMYNAWLKDPSSVHVSWDSFFRNEDYHSPPNLAPPKGEFKMRKQQASPLRDDKTVEEHVGLQAVIRNYQARGHLLAHLDPLQIVFPGAGLATLNDRLGNPPNEIMRQLPENLDKVFQLPGTTYIGGNEKELPMVEIIRRLEMTYCRHIGVEFMYLDNYNERNFIRMKMEIPGVRVISPDQKRLILARLTSATEFESFLVKKWPYVKRFGLEGLEMLIPAVRQIIDKSSDFGVEHFIIGATHRGRLNLLANLCRKPLHQIFTEFAVLEQSDVGSADVKYHLGTHTQKVNRTNNKNIKMTLATNPSHLETADGVVLGKAKAEQFYTGDVDGKKVMAILIHGDASYAGQGLVYETHHLSYLPFYTTKGTINIVINNQLGFTTDPRNSRSSPYCSDVGRVVNAPIFHVNADDPDSVIHCCNIASEWRAKFQKDIVIDIVGYRRHGHNEADEPMFTQPLMYTKIKNTKPVLQKYAQQLIKEKIMTEEEVKQVQEKYNKTCEEEFKKAKKQNQTSLKDWLNSPWSDFNCKDSNKAKPTGIPEDTLKHIGKIFSSPPPPDMNFVVHKGIERILNQRQQMVASRVVDWSLAEAMAFGSLVKEGVHVRLSGQDVQRGTFSHRHHVLHHQTIDKVTYNPISNLFPDQAPYTVVNSSLSEYGVLSFEFGFAWANLNSLIIWEAQFGDFANTAQVVFDQFLSSGEDKWMRQIGLVVLLPHGYEGMGPEHSSARIERYLQLCDDDQDQVPPIEQNFAHKQLHGCNWIIANCSTPANFFHILRRQIALPFRKPLIVFTPKSLLRHPDAKSSFDEMLEGTEFRRLIPDEGEASKDPQNVKKLLFCSGKVYYDVMNGRKEKKLEKEIALSRVEQFSPFPYDLIKAECDKYTNAKVCWLQEEHKNAGAYTYVLPRMQALLGMSRDVCYIGRPPAAAPATGNKVQHDNEVKNLMNDSLAL